MRQEKSSTLPNGRWHACARPSILQIAASILTVALCLTACASRKESSQAGTTAVRAYADSLINELRSKETVTVPQSQVVLKIPIDDLLRLPKDAGYHDKSGQASAEVQFNQDTVYIFATCDSLQRMCSYYERKYELYKGEYENLMALRESELEEEPPDIVRIYLSGVLGGVLLTITIIIIIKLKAKRI